ncbi:helix-turn-helix domain-containing protein [Cytobacillus firmus]|uniref:helix-turn-helix domain-containing protein n=1 Tax=Cytobacillus firmus TaxID=1399 RepID=UPI001CFE4B9C|nr:helix-turn-helix transcriptional regulator [Cytobacillus firmus]
MNKDLIKHLRSITNLSQTELADRVGVHQTIISRVESGTIPLHPKTEQALLRVFGEEGIGGQDIVLLHSIFESRKMKQVKKDWKCI